MGKKWALLVVFFAAGVSGAGVTPGTYELQNLAGERQGKMEVVLKKTTHLNAPAQRMEIKTTVDGDSGIGEEEEAIFDSKGLVSLRRVTREKNLETMIEGERSGENFVLRKKAGEVKMGFSVPLSEFDLSVQEMDLEKSPFFKMGAGDRRQARVLSADEFAAVKAVRIVQERKEVNFNGDSIDVYIVNTSIGGKVYHSWFEVKTRKLLYERGPDRILRRLD